MVELAGVLALEPGNTVFRNELSAGGHGADLLHPSMIPSSLLPRLHVILTQQLAPGCPARRRGSPAEATELPAFHPFIAPGLASPTRGAAAAMLAARAALAGARARVVTVLAAALPARDALAAEYLLGALLAKVLPALGALASSSADLATAVGSAIPWSPCIVFCGSCNSGWICDPLEPLEQSPRPRRRRAALTRGARAGNRLWCGCRATRWWES